MTTLIRGGLVHDAVHRDACKADILLADGKIAAIGTDLTAPADAVVFDADGFDVFPGFVDAHTHIGLDGYGIGYEGCDYNEMNDIWTPQLRAIDGINPRDPSLADARKAGVTCVCTGPGSANVLGGTFLAMKTIGDRVDNMIVKDPVAMKCAFGENPKRCYRDKCDSTRMSTAAFLRGALMQARDYGARKQAANGDVTKMPAYNQKLEALLPVLAREIPLKAHAHQANDIFTALRIAREFNLRLTLEHVTEGHLIADELAKEKDVPMAVGPSLTFASKFELQNKSWETPGVLANAGCHVSIITDNSVIPQQYLPLCAGMAVKAGMDPFDALKAITINPAEHIGVADRVGSLEVGKDADVVITNGCPFEVMTEV
uniref:amidohydrolase n=1 Tax=Gemmiger formicilis TaxID=745368 RepID=UPI0040282C1D